VTGAGPTENRLVQIQEALYRRLNALYDEKIEHLPKARAFVQYVRERNLVLDDGFYEKNTFIAVKPEDTFVSAYRQRLEAWKQEYPALDFTLPEDLHFTFHFSGHMPIRGLNRLLPAVNGAFDGISLTEGHFRIVGRKNNLLAIAFEYEKSVGDRVWEMRHLAVKLGAKPDRQFAGNWLAHATLARPKPGVSLAVFQTQLSAFMAESTGSLGQTSTTRTGVYEGLDDVEAGGIRYQQVIRVPH
jgi:2'-5' RNA ligase